MKMDKVILLVLALFSSNIYSQKAPIKHRTNVQAEVVLPEKEIDGEWVAVGTRAEHAIQHDYDIKFDGKPSYRFELGAKDNTLSGYKKGTTKGRAELSYAYARASDLTEFSDEKISNEIIMKNIYHYGKGFCDQGSRMKYKFSFYCPSEVPKNVKTIFAQWHGAPDRRLVQTPEGEEKMLTTEEFIELSKTVMFKKNIGYDKIYTKDKKGREVVKKGKENGWLVEQGGYPPLAFGFSDGYFYIKANSDRKLLSDKTDRTNASAEKSKVLVPQQSEYKSSVIAHRSSFKDFPKDTWVDFEIEIQWSEYS